MCPSKMWTKEGYILWKSSFKAGIETGIFMRNIHPLAYSSTVLLLYIEQK